MKRIGILLGLFLATVPLTMAEEWTKSFAITGKPELRVETSDAHIRVDTWDKNTIEARVTTDNWKIGEGGVRVYDHQIGDTVELEVRLPHHGFSIGITRGHRVEVVINMPREGRVRLHTGDGHIRLSNFKGDMQLDSGDGHQDVDGVDGSLRARTGDGHIHANGRFDLLDLSTGDGHIEVRLLPGSKLASSWYLRTGDGHVTVQVPSDIAADVSLHTNDGHINLELPVTVEGKVTDKSIRGKINGGGNLLTIHTGDGSIRLEKS